MSDPRPRPSSLGATAARYDGAPPRAWTDLGATLRGSSPTRHPRLARNVPAEAIRVGGGRATVTKGGPDAGPPFCHSRRKPKFLCDTSESKPETQPRGRRRAVARGPASSGLGPASLSWPQRSSSSPLQCSTTRAQHDLLSFEPDSTTTSSARPTEFLDLRLVPRRARCQQPSVGHLLHGAAYRRPAGAVMATRVPMSPVMPSSSCSAVHRRLRSA